TAPDPDADAAPAPDGARGSRPAAATATADSDWAVRVYRSEAGYTCPEAGREVDGDFGRVDGDGSFHPLALAASGQCVDLSKDQYSLDVDHYPADDQRGARAVVY